MLLYLIINDLRLLFVLDFYNEPFVYHIIQKCCLSLSIASLKCTVGLNEKNKFADKPRIVNFVYYYYYVLL